MAMLDWRYVPMRAYWSLVMTKRGTDAEIIAEMARLNANPHPGPYCQCKECKAAVNNLLRIPTGSGSWITM